ncbi:MAG TPA: hypothetical protein VGI98_08460 [Candidatus Limnocylindrales bacterium]
MDPLDHGRADLDGTTCAVCAEPVPSASTQVLAHREGLAFLQVECAGCGSTTLAFLLVGRGPDDRAEVTATNLATDLAPAADPVTADDVLDMHELLRGWHGTLADLVGPATGSDVR